jgi:outer membrane protein TolC
VSDNRYDGVRSSVKGFKKGFFLVFLLLCAVYYSLSIASASERSSLQVLIDEAIANNPEIKAYRGRYIAKKARVKAEGMLDDPSLKMEMMEIPQDSPFNVGKSTVTKLTVSQVFPFPGKLSLKEEVALKQSLMAEAELRDKELDIIKKVKDAYYDYYYVIRSIEITEELKEIIKRMLTVAEVKYSTGLVSQHDVIKAQVELSLLEKSLLDLNARKEIIQARINTLLDRDVGTMVTKPSRVKARKVNINIEGLRGEVLKNNPMLKALEFELKSKEAGILLARKAYYPNLMVGLGYLQKDDKDDAWQAMLGVNIPIWRSKYDSRVREKSAKSEAASSRLHAERNKRLFDLELSYERFRSIVDVVKLYETGLLPQTELAFNSAITNYETGKVSFITLLDNERVLLKTNIGYIKAVADYNKKLAAMERVIGREIVWTGEVLQEQVSKNFIERGER